MDFEEDDFNLPPTQSAGDAHEESQQRHPNRCKERLQELHVVRVAIAMLDVLCGALQKDYCKKEHQKYQHGHGPDQRSDGAQQRVDQGTKLPEERYQPCDSQSAHHTCKPENPDVLQIEPVSGKGKLENCRGHDDRVEEVPMPVRGEAEVRLQRQDAEHQLDSKDSCKQAVDQRNQAVIRGCASCSVTPLNRSLYFDISRNADDNCVHGDEESDNNCKRSTMYHLKQSLERELAEAGHKAVSSAS
mmetsp:Transcript_51825/g.138263  ORF Transcript_51825/g.138263 Transcript_51825/m.138263 type:complete len:245 (+) Transcript_51825:3-737(+)